MLMLYTTYSTQFFVFNSSLTMPTELHILFQQRMIIYGRSLGAKWNTAACVCLGFPSWCKIIATVPLRVSPSTHLTCLAYDHNKLLQISKKIVSPFSAHHSCFCTSCIVSAAFTSRTCITYHLDTAY